MTSRFLRVATLVAACIPVALHAQSNETGVSHPELVEPTPVQATIAETVEAKPSPAVPVAAIPRADAHSPVMLASSVDTPAPIPANTDSGIVTRVPVRPGELAEGTILRTNLDDAISTEFTQPGTPFTARITQNVTQDGHVIIPIGSSLHGRVTKVVENRRIKGRAKLRLRPDEIVMPDGTHLMLHAQVIDTDKVSGTRTDGEGTIVSRDNAKKSWAITGATTGTGAITGAVVGGGIGAAVGSIIGAGIGATHFMVARQVASLPKSSSVVFQLTEPMSIAPLRD